MTNLPVISCFLNIDQLPPTKWGSDNMELLSNEQPCIFTCLAWLTLLMALVEAFVQCILLLAKRYPAFFEGVACFQDDESPAERSIRIEKCLQVSQFHRFSDYGTCCPICLNDFESKELVVSGVRQCCKNRFHKKCLSSWLQTQSTCPCCRYEILRAEKS